MNTENTSPTDQHQPQALSSAALARRHILLKGLGKSSAVLAAGIPISTLAAPTTLGGEHLCTVSGVQSNVGSRVKDANVCMGYKPTHYLNNSGSATDPNKISPQNANKQFNEVFGGGSSSKLKDILTSVADSNEKVWVTAWLNALSAPANFYYPYTAAEVLKLYSGSDSAKALEFFRRFMQSVD